ncbi:MAG: hypothetical protein WC273_08815 [Dehalococcoidia bacterium]
MSWHIEPDDVAFGGVDAVSIRVARALGYRNPTVVTTQAPVRLPEFGPRRIHSTREVVPDPLQDDAPVTGDWFLSAGETFNRIHIYGDRSKR